MQIKEINTNLILEPAEQMRSVITQEGLDDLISSIKSIGLIEPILVKPMGEKYEVIAGHRRLLACRYAGLLVIPCLIKTSLDTDDDTIKIHENFCRENINPADEASFYADLINRKNISIDELANNINRSGAYVRDRINLLRGDEAVLEAVRGGQILAGVAKELNLIVSEETRRYYLQFAVDSGAKLRTVQEWRRNDNRDVETQKVLDNGHTPAEFSQVLPKYYCECPVCKQPTILEKMRALSVCEECHGDLMSQLAQANQK